MVTGREETHLQKIIVFIIIILASFNILLDHFVFYTTGNTANSQLTEPDKEHI